MITIHVTSKKLSGMIEFNDLSENDYQKLAEFVESLNENDEASEVKRLLVKHLGGDGVKDNSPSKDESKPFSEDDIDEDEEDDPKRVEGIRRAITKKPLVGGHKVNTAKNQELKNKYDAFVSIIEYAKKHPEEYEFKHVRTKDFIDEHPEEFGGINESLMGRFASKYGMERVVVPTNYTGTPRRMRAYPMRIRKEEQKKPEEDKKEEVHEATKAYRLNDGETMPGWGVKQSDILKKKRSQVGLTINELSKLIGYPFYAIQAWENGSAAPSADALNALCSKYGNSLKAELGVIA